MEVLFKGPLNNANYQVKCNYIIYWSGDTGMELVEKWEIEGKITDANRNNMNCGCGTQETFLRLVKEAEYSEAATWDRILRDTLISGLASDKIHAKIIKEGNDVTIARGMEITRLEVSTQKHIDRMQGTVKVNYVQYGKGFKK